jgi:tetratricopeptide (TPR) repeat protein
VKEATRRATPLAIAAALVILTAAAFEGVRRCDFVGFDDNIYVFGHPYVRQGLTWEGVRWALAADLLFESAWADYWMPLTVLSRMADVEMFGLDPEGHHAMNAALHALNVVLVFFMLSRTTGALGRSALAAAVFAVHPVTVESVAWVTERKDVLSALFWMLAVIAYARFAKAGGLLRYSAVAALMALGLMAKPTLIMLPFVLLVLDVWPLRRMAASNALRRVAEKVPLLVLSIASAALTLLAHARGGHLASTDELPLGSRMANAAWALVVYVGQVLWPSGLAVPYPYEASGLGAKAAVAALLLLLAGAVVVRSAPAHPYILTGTAWYVLALVPVLGIVQTGQQARADRFLYIPVIGLAIVASWGLAELAGRSKAVRAALPWAAATALFAGVALTRAQVRHWESTIALFSHAVAVTKDNAVAHHNLAAALALEGDLAGAERHDREATRIAPDYVEARSALGVVLTRQGRVDEAALHLEVALRHAPSSADVRFNLGVLRARMGRTDEAAAHYAEAVRLSPSLAAAHYNWGNLLAAAGRWREAEARYRETVRLEPDHVDAVNNLALAVAQQGGWAEAARILEGLVARHPDQARARVNLGRALRELGRREEAGAQWREAILRRPDDPSSAEAREELARLDSIRAPR